MALKLCELWQYHLHLIILKFLLKSVNFKFIGEPSLIHKFVDTITL